MEYEQIITYLESLNTPEADAALKLINELHKEVDDVDEFYSEFVDRFNVTNLRVVN